MNKKLLNAIVFQTGWFICIMLDAYLAVLFTIVALALHFGYVVEPSKRVFEAFFIGIMLLIGAIFEALYLLSQVLVVNEGSLLPPVWLLMLWVLFATTLNHSLSWLASKPYLAGVLTAIAAPWSYYAGVHLKDSVEFGLSLPVSLVIIGLSWSVLMVVTYHYLASRSQDDVNKSIAV